MEWISKNASALMLLVTISGWVWSYAKMEAKVKQLEERLSGNEKWRAEIADKHFVNTEVHRDPHRDEQRLGAIETALKEIHRLLISINANTKGLTGNGS